MMKKVAEGQNPHVISLVGCVTIQEPLSLIIEFIRYGDLLSYLRTNRRNVHYINYSYNNYYHDIYYGIPGPCACHAVHW